MAEPKTQAILKDLGIALQEPPLTPKHVSDIMRSAFGGSDAEGAWCWRQSGHRCMLQHRSIRAHS